MDDELKGGIDPGTDDSTAVLHFHETVTGRFVSGRPTHWTFDPVSPGYQAALASEILGVPVEELSAEQIRTAVSTVCFGSRFGSTIDLTENEEET